MKKIFSLSLLGLLSVAFSAELSPEQQRPATIQQIQDESKEDDSPDETPDEDVIIIDEDGTDTNE